MLLRATKAICLFFVCHPGSMATFASSRDFLLRRYPNRDVLLGADTALQTLSDRRRGLKLLEKAPEATLDETGPVSRAARALALRVAPAERVEPHREVVATNDVRARDINRTCRLGSAAGSTAAFVTPPTVFKVPHYRAAAPSDGSRLLRLSGPSRAARVAASCPCLHSLDAGFVRGSDAFAKPRRRRPGARMLFGRGFGAGGGNSQALRVPSNQSKFSKSSSIADLSSASAVGSTAAGAALPMDFASASSASAAGGYSSVARGNGRAAAQEPTSLGQLLRGAATAIDDAVSFVECKLVTSGVGRRLLEPQVAHALTTPASLARAVNSATPVTDVTDHMPTSFELVGFMDVQDFDAGRRTRMW